MKTHKVRPVLVEAKESTLHLSHGKLIYSIKTTGKSILYNSTPQQLILISLEDEKIGEGDYYYLCGDIYPYIFSCSGDPLTGALKVIATQSQLSPELINQLVSEYNNGGMKDFEIEMEAIPNEFDNPMTNPLGVDDFEGSEWETKLTNGFVTVVEKEPILYPKQDMKDAFIAGAKSDTAKEYHTKGMYTQEQLDEQLDLQACKTTAQVIKNVSKMMYSEEEVQKIIEDIDDLYRPYTRNNILGWNYFNENKKK